MKKKIRAQLMALAQQIIDEQNTWNVASLKKLSAEIHEKLVIAEYLETQLEGAEEIRREESLDSKSFREENWFIEPEPVPQPDHKEDLIEPLMEKIKDIVAQMPEESERIDEMLDEMIPKAENKKSSPHSEKTPQKASSGNGNNLAAKERFTQNDLEDFASSYQTMPEFERKSPQKFPPSQELKPASKGLTESRAKSINESINKGLSIGLNDRLAFIKHLFEGQAEDYTRVLSQINTLDTFEQAEDFIDRQVKPDYNHWENKEEYSQRFMAAVEKRFN